MTATAGGAYTPGLKVVAAMRYTVRRLLPISGTVVVKPGDRVEARQVVAETFMPGDISPLNLAKLLSMPPGDVPECMMKKEGERIEPGDVLARTKGIFGKFRQEYKSHDRRHDRIDLRGDRSGHRPWRPVTGSGEGVPDRPGGRSVSQRGLRD